jgi:hypothetical protein
LGVQLTLADYAHHITASPPGLENPVTIQYSVVSIKRTGCNKQTGWRKKFLLVHEKKIRVVKFFHLVHEKKVQGGKKLQNS